MDLRNKKNKNEDILYHLQKQEKKEKNEQKPGGCELNSLEDRNNGRFHFCATEISHSIAN